MQARTSCRLPPPVHLAAFRGERVQYAGSAGATSQVPEAERIPVNGSQLRTRLRPRRQDAGPQPSPPPLPRAIERARRCLLDMQQPDGHWVGELQGDTILESEYVLLLAFLGREDDEVCR